MPRDFNRFTFSDDTEVKITGGDLTIAEKQWLNDNGALRISGFQTSTGEITTAELDAKKLSQIAFEYDLLKEVASSVETEILAVFRHSEDRTLTTGEITNETERPKSSVSRALARLSEKEKLTKVQAGVYRYE